MSLQTRIDDLAQAVGADVGGVQRATMARAVALTGTYLRRAVPCDLMTQATAAFTPPVNRIIFVPITCHMTYQVVSLRAMNDSVTGAGGTGWRLGLYGSDASGAPASRLHQSGNLSSSPYAELIYTLPAPEVLAPGRYWLAIAHNYTTAPNMMGCYIASNTHFPNLPLGVYMGTGPVRVTALYYALAGGWTQLPVTADAVSGMSVYKGTDGVPSMYMMVQ